MLRFLCMNKAFFYKTSFFRHMNFPFFRTAAIKKHRSIFRNSSVQPYNIYSFYIRSRWINEAPWLRGFIRKACRYFPIENNCAEIICVFLFPLVNRTWWICKKAIYIYSRCVFIISRKKLSAQIFLILIKIPWFICLVSGIV